MTTGCERISEYAAILHRGGRPQTTVTKHSEQLAAPVPLARPPEEPFGGVLDQPFETRSNGICYIPRGGVQ